MTRKLDNGDTTAGKSYIRLIIDTIEVDDRAIRSRDVLQAVIARSRTRAEMLVVLYANGAPEEIRTPDPQIRSLVLYPAELRARLSLVSRGAMAPMSHAFQISGLAGESGP